MAETLDTVDPAKLAGFDDIIDVRSPGEFAEDHMPGAINLPVLNDAERAEIGTIYVQDSRFRAKRIGAAYVARNIALHLETALADRTGGWNPLVYCWRGGQRSNAMATVLRQVGWRTTLVEGGYRTWRRHVTATLYDAEPALRVILLDGNTGSAKTEILGRVASRGVQVLDLEGLAGHRGSVFGGLAGVPQPSQKMFESRLLGAINALDPARPVLVEAESSKIGDRMVPPTLWKAMRVAPRIALQVAPADRARYLVTAYRDITADQDALAAALGRMPPLYGRKRLAEWGEMARAGDFETLAEALIEIHYDPAYGRSNRRDERPCLGVVVPPALDEAGQETAADAIVALMPSD
ncbi:MAG: tRNA 2-selenouridine(34) synthase MnmH [Caulobacter sp.]|nr:tRNA 2-selenouridine(34) synthase MnmH [Caulobacter sp.]